MMSALIPLLILSALLVVVPLAFAIRHAACEAAHRHKNERGC